MADKYLNDVGLAYYHNRIKPKLLPDVTTTDNGKVLEVVNGAWTKNKLDSTDVSYSNSGMEATNVKTALDAIESALETKVDKVTGKQLSTNDFTDAYKTKLDGIGAGAQPNPAHYLAELEISGGTEASPNVVYRFNTRDANGSNTKAQSIQADATPNSSYATHLVTSKGVADALNGKQDTLVSGTNIKTINSNSILGSGNLTIRELPSVTTSDNDKVLQVVNGVWVAKNNGVFDIDYQPASQDSILADNAVDNVGDALDVLDTYVTDSRVWLGTLTDGHIETAGDGYDATVGGIARTVTTSTGDFTLTTNNRIIIKDVEFAILSSPSVSSYHYLNIDNTGYKELRFTPTERFPSRLTTTDAVIGKNIVTGTIEVMYDGTYYIIIGGDAFDLPNGVKNGTYKVSANAKTTGVYYFPSITVDEFGKITSASNYDTTITIPEFSAFTDPSQGYIRIAYNGQYYFAPYLYSTWSSSTYPTTQTIRSKWLPDASSSVKGAVIVDDAMSSSSTNPVQNSVVKAYIDNAIAGGASFQGAVNAGTDISSLTNYKAGWYWIVQTAGTYVGQTCEVGDMIYCISNYNSAYSASDFSVVQKNVDMTLYWAKSELTAITTAEIDTLFAS